jgi:hypothetical protein
MIFCSWCWYASKVKKGIASVVLGDPRENEKEGPLKCILIYSGQAGKSGRGEIVFSSGSGPVKPFYSVCVSRMAAVLFHGVFPFETTKKRQENVIYLRSACAHHNPDKNRD